MISSHLSIDPLPRRPNHSLTDSIFPVSFLFDTSVVIKKPSLEASRGDLGPSEPLLGRSWTLLGGLGRLQGWFGEVPGASWGGPGGLLGPHGAIQDRSKN